jgi:transposase
MNCTPHLKATLRLPDTKKLTASLTDKHSSEQQPGGCMVIIGIDPHPGSHTAVALASTGRRLGHVSVVNGSEGLAVLEKWLRCYDIALCAVEGANNPFARKLSQRLLARGYKVVNVSPSLTSQYRSKRGRSKSDVVDAEHVAKAALANPELADFRPQQKIEALKSLSRTREMLVTQLTAHRLSLKSCELAQARQALEAVIAVLVEQIKVLEASMKRLVEVLMPELLTVQGVGVVHAATLLAEAGDVRRFRSQHSFAMFAGCAPVERSSGGQQRRQLNIGGNRRLKRSFHMIALVRLRCDEASAAYIAKKRHEGKTLRAALRCLKTHLARALFRFMRDNISTHPYRWLNA